MAVSPVPAMPRTGGHADSEVHGVLSAVAACVEGRLTRLIARERARWAAIDVDVLDMLETLAALLLAPAKRLRPAFCHWAFVAAGGEPDDPRLVDAEAAIELLHAFALLHDDVMDGSAIRRGVRTSHL